MTSPSPDIESLIAAGNERHWNDGGTCFHDDMVWPCPDRLLIDALVPVYEAAKAWRADFDEYGYGVELEADYEGRAAALMEAIDGAPLPTRETR